MNEEEEQPLINFIDKGGIAGYLNRNYKDKTIGKEITPHVRSGLQILGDSYQDTMWKARRGMLGPHSFVGAHAIDTIGKIIPDIPLDKAISHGLHNWGGIDEPLADVGGEVGEALAIRKVLKSIKPEHLGISQKIEPYWGKSSKPNNIENKTRIMDEVLQIPKYSSGAIVQTNKGPLYRPTPDTLSSVFQSNDKPTPPSKNPLYKGKQRNEQAKTTKGVIYPIVKDLGGSEVQAKQIWEKVNKEFQSVTKATSKLNELWRNYAENDKVDIFENKDGTVTLGIVPRHNIALPGEKPRYKASWQFEKDHIRAVINQLGESGGMNMAENMEIIFGKINREKSNLYQLPEGILSELAIPKNITEYVFNELHPEYQTLQSKIPERFKESFTKNILNDYYEQIYGGQPYKRGVQPTVGKKKWPSIMRNITEKYARLYKNEKFLIGLTMLDDQPSWEIA